MSVTKINKQQNRPYPVCIGSVCLPSEIDRQEYIDHCFRTERISIVTEKGSMIRNCYITQEALNNIDFPTDEKKLGTSIIYVYTTAGTIPIVIGTVTKQNETNLLEEGLFRLKKKFVANNVFIDGDAKRGVLSLNVNTFDSNTSEIHINLSSKNNTILKISHNGDTEIYSKKSLKQTTDTFESVNKKATFTTDEFIIGKGKEPMVLGDTVAKFLGDLIEEISKATVSTMLGTQPLLNAAQIIAFKQRLNEFKSEIAKLD